MNRGRDGAIGPIGQAGPQGPLGKEEQPGRGRVALRRRPQGPVAQGPIQGAAIRSKR